MTKYKLGDQFYDSTDKSASLTIVRIDTAAPFSASNPCYDCRIWQGSYSPGVAVKFQTELDSFYKKYE